MSGPAAVATLTIPARFSGPDGSANGGYACGLLAGVCSGPVAVTLHAPPRLDTPMRVEHHARRAHLWDDDTLVATAAASRRRVAAVDPVPATAAQAAAGRYRGRAHHPFPRCFACGPHRSVGDGLRLGPGPVPGRTDTVACVWAPERSVLAADGRVRTEVVWAVLDCPSGWTVDLNAALMVLGWMRADILDRPVGGRDCVVVARLDRADDDGIAATSALYDDSGVLLAAAATRWYRPRPGGSVTA